MARYQRGFLRKKKGKWVYCYTAIRSIDGKRTERGRILGFVSELSKSGAWAEVERRGLNILVNEPDAGKQPTFGFIASHYLENHKFKNHGTKYLHNHIVKDYLIPRFGPKVANEIKSKEILVWLESQTFEECGEDGLENSTLGKIKTVMGGHFQAWTVRGTYPSDCHAQRQGAAKGKQPSDLRAVVK